MTEDKDQLLQKAMVCEQVERFDEMVDFMKKFVVASDADINDNERKMLSNAYKSVIGQKRSSWRKISSLLQNMAEDNPKRALVQDYLATIAADLINKCNDLRSLLEDSLLPKATLPEAKVFFLKMKADHLRYLVEVSTVDNTELRNESKEAYKVATEISKLLSPAHAFRLGLALNFSVFLYEIESLPEKAREVAQAAFDLAVPELEKLSDTELEDTTTMMQLLRDNLAFWTEPEGEDL